jgi:YVTN family beta-propeller protein
MGALVERKVVPAGPSPIQLCAADDGNLIAALAGGGTSLTILDGRTSEASAAIDVGSSPWNGVSNGPLVYLACLDAVQVVDAVAGRLVATILLAKGSRPRLVVPAFDRQRLYALNSGDGTVSAIDSTTLEVSRTIEVGAGPQYAQRFDGTLYVVSSQSNEVAIIDESGFEVIQRVPVGPAPERCVFNQNRTELWTNNMDDGTLSVVDLTSRSVVATVRVGPEPIRLTPWDSRNRDEWGILCRASIAGPEGTITFVDGATHVVTESLPLPGRTLNWNWGLGARHQVVYVTLSGDSQLAIVDAVRAEVTDMVRTSMQPEPAGYGPGIVISKWGGVFVASDDSVTFLMPNLRGGRYAYQAPGVVDTRFDSGHRKLARRMHSGAGFGSSKCAHGGGAERAGQHRLGQHDGGVRRFVRSGDPQSAAGQQRRLAERLRADVRSAGQA